MSAAARKAVKEAFSLDDELREVLDDMPPLPRVAVSLQQLATAASHLRAALRLLEDVRKREAPLQQDDDFEVQED